MGLAELTGDEGSDDRCRTFVFEGEDHTLGNALQGIISRYPETTFCAYTVPHPLENKINLRIQTSGPKAIHVLKRGLKDLEQHCITITELFNEAVAGYRSARQAE